MNEIERVARAMDFDDVIERAAKAAQTAVEAAIRAAAPILMEYGAWLAIEAVLPEVVTDRTVDAHGAHCRCTTCELNITEDSIRALDPAKIVGEV